MRFIVDAQLPMALVRCLREEGYEAEHVFDLLDKSAPDREIWTTAQRLGYAIITKDEDFAVLSVLKPEGPPVVLVRVGNTRKRALIELFVAALSQIAGALQEGDRLVEVR